MNKGDLDGGYSGKGKNELPGSDASPAEGYDGALLRTGHSGRGKGRRKSSLHADQRQSGGVDPGFRSDPSLSGDRCPTTGGQEERPPLYSKGRRVRLLNGQLRLCKGRRGPLSRRPQNSFRDDPTAVSDSLQLRGLQRLPPVV